MSEQNKALVERLIDEFWNEGRTATADELVAESHVVIDPATPGEYRGPEGLKQFAAIYRNAFPDLHFTSLELVGEGDAVAQRWRVTGTHRGDLPGIPATGQPIDVTGITISRIRDGRFTELCVVWDALGLMRQLGVAPAMAAAG